MLICTCNYSLFKHTMWKPVADIIMWELTDFTEGEGGADTQAGGANQA